MNSKNLFLEKFEEFLENENKFFNEYKKAYAIHFLQILKKNYPQIQITKEVKNLILNFYTSLFLSPCIKKENFKPFIKMKEFLFKHKIEISIIDKTFLLLANNYIKKIFTSSNLEKLKTLTLLLDFYSKLINKEIEFKKETFLSQLEKIYKTKTPIILFGVYKGIPLSNKVRITSINKKNNSIMVNANNYQLIASKFQKEIYFLEPKSNKTFRGFVKDISMYKKRLIISDIKEIKRSSLKRNYIRVQPKEKLKAVIKLDRDFEGYIYDLSLKGISIISKNQIPINIEENVKIEFNINNETLSFLAELKSISKYEEDFRYHFYFEPTKSEEAKLEKYITNREKEIINELNDYLKKEFIEL